jgi:hypothetical protein
LKDVIFQGDNILINMTTIREGEDDFIEKHKFQLDAYFFKQFPHKGAP